MFFNIKLKKAFTLENKLVYKLFNYKYKLVITIINKRKINKKTININYLAFFKN